VKLIRDVVDKMLVILPFEKEFYETKWDYKVEYVGHPLVQVIEEFTKETPHALSFEKPVIAVLPGSRQQEIRVKLPIMLQVQLAFPQYQFVVAKASSIDDAFYEQLLAPFPGVLSVRNKTYALLTQSAAALVTSGTATLETALFGVPQVVCYKGSSVSYAIAKRLIKIKYISLVNLIIDKPVVKELIQHELTPANLELELRSLLTDPRRQEQVREDYSYLKKLLQQGGNASQKAARIIMDFLKVRTSTTA
jgi:lipid-A-disaccharide synthase